MKRIICIGNRLFAPDATGPLVYDILTESGPPAEVEIVDGGLAGLDLLPLLGNGDRVVFVDAAWGLADEPGVVVVDEARLLAASDPAPYGHGAGLPFLLRMRRQIFPDAALPEVLLVGIEGEADPGALREAAAVAVRVASFGAAPWWQEQASMAKEGG